VDLRRATGSTCRPQAAPRLCCDQCAHVAPAWPVCGRATRGRVLICTSTSASSTTSAATRRSSISPAGSSHADDQRRATRGAAVYPSPCPTACAITRPPPQSRAKWRAPDALANHGQFPTWAQIDVRRSPRRGPTLERAAPKGRLAGHDRLDARPTDGETGDGPQSGQGGPDTDRDSRWALRPNGRNTREPWGTASTLESRSIIDFLA
jgi:hypothetical protein